MRQPVAYIRRSARSRSDPGDYSREFQIDTVRRLAGNDPNLRILDGDWGKSASTDAIDTRLDFLTLLEDIEAGRVSTLYAYSTDRLARSVRWAAQLLDACERAGTTIATNEGTFRPGDDLARTMFQFQAIGNEDYSRKARAKRRSTVEQMRSRGVKLGAPYYGALPGEDVQAVLAAYDRIGTLTGTAKELNRSGIPARRGHWAQSSVQRILARAGLVPTVGVKGSKHRQEHTFARLLRCHCGHVMAGSRRSNGTTMYRCVRGETDIDHGRKSVNEGQLMPWAVAEMSRLRPPVDAVTLAEEATAEADRLRPRLDRAKRLYLDGEMSREEYEAERDATTEAITRLEVAGAAIRVPTFEWDHEPRALNRALRALWGSVQLDRDLRPERADWLVPASWLVGGAPG